MEWKLLLQDIQFVRMFVFFPMLFGATVSHCSGGGGGGWCFLLGLVGTVVPSDQDQVPNRLGALKLTSDDSMKDKWGGERADEATRALLKGQGSIFLQGGLGHCLGALLGKEKYSFFKSDYFQLRIDPDVGFWPTGTSNEWALWNTMKPYSSINL